MASEKGNGPPSYDATFGYPREAPGSSVQQPYPPSTTPYPLQGSASHPVSVPPGYPVQDPQALPPQGQPQGALPGYPLQGAPPGYPLQGAPPGYPPQGAPPGYLPQGASPGYPPHNAPQGYPKGAAPGYTTQTVPAQGYHSSTQTTTVITQQPGVIVHHTVAPPDNMVLSVISMFCCFFIGIFALLRSIKSREQFRLGNYAGAAELGLHARKLAIIAIVVAVCIYVTCVVVRIILNVL